jgi:hypothetical protein
MFVNVVRAAPIYGLSQGSRRDARRLFHLGCQYRGRTLASLQCVCGLIPQRQSWEARTGFARQGLGKRSWATNPKTARLAIGPRYEPGYAELAGSDRGNKADAPGRETHRHFSHRAMMYPGIFGRCSLYGGVLGLFVVPGFGAFANCGDAVMANERTFAERRPYERRLMGRGILRRRALALIVIGLAFTFMGGVNLDVFEVTVGCIAVAAGGAWRWCL